jgi:hypothetical protein
MKVEQRTWTAEQNWKSSAKTSLKDKAHLVLAFGHRESIADPAHYDDLKKNYPNALILIASTSGEIVSTEVRDQSIVATAVQFERTQVAHAQVNITAFSNSSVAGAALIEMLPPEGLRHVLIISDGQMVNGSDLIQGINSRLPEGVSVTGGLAGDGAQFQKTLVGINDYPSEGNIIAIGLYGEALQVGYGSMGGWDTFGPERAITKAEANVLFELDNKPALELYKTYLGEKAAELPASGLLFPLAVSEPHDKQHTVVRTLLAVNEAEQSMTFAGNLPVGGTAQLMKANFDRLIDGAAQAAEISLASEDGLEPQLAILISCVGRKLILGQRIEEEVEAVMQAVGKNAKVTGFYSYGELAPDKKGYSCMLHNQTMTITLLSEK